MKNRLRASGWIATITVVLLLLVPGAPRNPPVIREKTIAAALDIPPHVQRVIDKACASCHSNQTAWPWYSRLAPISWLTARDVNLGREAMNFSEWTDQDSAYSAGILEAACGDIQSGRMPLAPYKIMHPEARLTSAETSEFCRWTNSAMQTILAAKSTPGKARND
jgi:hypothetical protein